MDTQPETQSSPARRIVREAERKRLTGYSRMQWYRLEKLGRVPRRVRMGDNAVGWFEDELIAWQARLASARGKTA